VGNDTSEFRKEKMSVLLDAMNALQAEAATYSQGVQVWMRIMAASYFAGIVFVPWRREGLWIVLMAASTFVLLVMGKMLEPTLTRLFLGSVVHLVLWPLILLLLWSPAARIQRRADDSRGLWRYVFQAWLIWVTALIVISLVFDAKFVLSSTAGT
tara:strand:+ start:3047 stop:3511 length:465 start_codon:yes stop_codon:yes gene_type:complete